MVKRLLSRVQKGLFSSIQGIRKAQKAASLRFSALSKTPFPFLKRLLVESRHFLITKVLYNRRHLGGRVYRLLSPLRAHYSLIAIGLFGLLTVQVERRALAFSSTEFSLSPSEIVESLQSLDRYTEGISEGEEDLEFAFLSIESLEKPGILSTNKASKQKRTADYLKISTQYVVQKGDTVSGIASKFDLHVDSLLIANDLSIDDIESLKIGATLSIPADDISNSRQWLAEINRRKAEEAKQRDIVAARLAKERQRSIVRTAPAPDRDLSGAGLFVRPAGGYMRNGYHSWAVDISGGGLTIVASADGVVTKVGTGWNGGYGNYIVVNHGDGWETLYAHNSANLVSAGQRVSGGQEIATMGASGRVIPKGAAHLHFEIRKNGRRLNPVSYVR